MRTSDPHNAPVRLSRKWGVSRAQVRTAQQWIDFNLTEPIGVEEVAAAIGVGVRSLQMSFKRSLGCSPHEFITRRRLEKARVLRLMVSPHLAQQIY